MRRKILLGIFIVSGFTGLIYESIWSHYLKLFLGHAAYAQTLVLAIFMGGMALGSWIVAKYSSRLRQLLLGYVAVEAVIGLFGLVFHKLFVGATGWTFDAVIPALGSPAAIHIFKWTLAALLILPQSTLLGMTFPLISGGIIRRWPQQPGETLSMLYFTNCLGAALGVLVSGFLLIRLVGLPGTIFTAGLLNVLLAFAVYAILKKSEEPAPLPAPQADKSAGAARWFLAAAFLTGAASFLYEIGWIRMLSLVLGSSTHSFELMLSAFIFGLACGGFWMRRRLDAVRDAFRYLGVVMILMGGFALLTLPGYNSTFDVMAWTLRSLSPTDGGYTIFNLSSQALCVLVMVPATFCAGMTLPILTHALLRVGGEKAIGSIYAANTVGAIVGILAAVHLLLPLAGVKGAIVAGALIHMGVGVSSLLRSAQSGSGFKMGAAMACVAAIAIAVVAVQLDPMRITSGVYRTHHATHPEGSRVSYLRHGKTATISLLERDGTVIIATNGKPDAGIQMDGRTPSIDEITMVMAAALPLSMHPSPQRVANIGFGSGLTGHALLSSPAVQHLDSVEIEPFMVEAAKRGFYKRVHRVFEDPRSRIVYEDAKTFFATQSTPYDIIISEPSNPWVSGVATLFSDEFYRHVVRYLEPDGLLVQWVQIYETDMNILASVMKALAPHFADYAVYAADDTNILVVATPQGRVPEPTSAVFGWTGMRAELAMLGVESVEQIRMRRVADRRYLQPLIESYGSPANSDYFPFVDLNAPRLRFLKRTAVDLTALANLPFPLLELADSGYTPAHPEHPILSTFLRRDVNVSIAMALVSAAKTGELAGLPTEYAQHLVMLDTPAARCRDLTARTAWLNAVRGLSDLTSTFQPPERLEGLWARVTTSACYREPGAHRTWADLLHAVARRDVSTVDRLGGELLASKDWQRFAADVDYVASVTAAARLYLRRPHDALLALDLTISEHPRQARTYALAQTWLRTLANAPPADAVTAAN